MTQRVRAADDCEDRRLLARVAAGDRFAFERLYAAYARRVLAFVRDIVLSAELAEEIASDTMIAVWRSAGRYRGDSRVMTWVLGIAHHKTVDAVRREAGEPVEHASIANHWVDRVDELIGIEDRFVFDHAMRALSAEHRTVLQLMYGFGCSQTEIAAIVRCPLATVKTRVFYAKRRLRRELDHAAAAEKLA